MKQQDQIRQHLITHGNIDTKTAITEYWCTRLSQYILLLRKEGMDIFSVWQSNGDKRWVDYRLRKI